MTQRELTSIAVRLDGRCSDSDRTLLAQKKAELEHVAATSIHNLAVLYHLQAISLEIGSDGRGKQDNTERLSNWNKIVRVLVEAEESAWILGGIGGSYP